MKLDRTIQCSTCPWKKTTNSHDIPYGYCETKHANLASTIAKPIDLESIGNPLRAMACHHSAHGNEQMCVGWLYNQLGIGNNLALRIRMLKCENLKDLQIIGEQHERFEDTLPKNLTIDSEK